MAVLLDRDADPTRRLLDQLVAASLLDVADADHYRIHDLVSAFAAECRNATISVDDVRRARIRLWHHICAVGEVAMRHTDHGRPIRLPWPDELEPPPVIQSISSSEAVAWFEKNIDLACAAIVDAAERGPVEYSWLLAERAWRAVRWVADVGRFEDALEAAYLGAMQQDAVRPAVIMCRLRGVTHGRRGDLDGAEAAFTQAIALARLNPRQEEPNIDRSNRAVVWSMRGELARAIDELAEVAGEPGTPSERVPALTALVDFELERGGLAAAQTWLETARMSASELWGTALQLEIDLSEVLVELAMGQYEAAFERSRAVEEAARASSNRELLARAITLKARACARRGELERAVEIAKQANNVAAAATPRQVQLDAVLALADVECRLDRFDEALAQLTPAAALARAAGERYLECQVLALTAQAYAGRGDSVLAMAAAEAATSIADVCGYTPLAADLAELIGELTRRA